MKIVSILVLMESGFLLEGGKLYLQVDSGFYPCFNGIGVLTDLLYKQCGKRSCSFYPCFNGIGVLTAIIGKHKIEIGLEFLSLF